jgi:hypothetical protein
VGKELLLLLLLVVQPASALLPRSGLLLSLRPRLHQQLVSVLLLH